MKKIKYALLALLAVLMLSSCDTSLPMPIVGCYRVSEFKENSEAFYYLALNEDGTFTLYQAGGAVSSDPFIFTGKWDASLTAFDFVRGEGLLTFTDVEGPTDVLGLALTAGKDNEYRFYWQHDRNTADATLSLKSLNRYYCLDISTGFNITYEEFDRVTGTGKTEEAGV